VRQRAADEGPPGAVAKYSRIALAISPSGFLASGSGVLAAHGFRYGSERGEPDVGCNQGDQSPHARSSRYDQRLACPITAQHRRDPRR
jgi:hypothetical protein